MEMLPRRAIRDIFSARGKPFWHAPSPMVEQVFTFKGNIVLRFHTWHGLFGL
jgi:hypothetical protein